MLIEKVSIPSARDVLKQPLSLFTNSVIALEPKTFNAITTENYQSFIAAIGKYADSVPWNLQMICEVQNCGDYLLKILSEKEIIIPQNEHVFIMLLSSIMITEHSWFSVSYKRFKENIG